MPDQSQRTVAESPGDGIDVRNEVDELIRAACPHMPGAAVSSQVGPHHPEPAIRQRNGNILPTGTLVEDSVQAEDQRPVGRPPGAEAQR